MRSKLISLAFLALAAFAQPGFAAEAPERPAPQGGVLSLLPPPQVTEHSITLGGRKL
ncbi:MAG: peptidase S10, partial [Mesorhizobium sp.]